MEGYRAGLQGMGLTRGRENEPNLEFLVRPIP